MHISYQSFAWTVSIGLPIAGVGLWLSSGHGKRLWSVRLPIALILALACTPTVWAPMDRYYVEAAGIAVFAEVVGLIEPSYGFRFGMLPVLGMTTLLFIGWTYWQRRTIRNRPASSNPNLP